MFGEGLSGLGARAAQFAPGTWAPREPVRPAWVNLDALFAAPDPPRHQAVDGLVLTGEVPGMVKHWIRGSHGLYLGVCHFELSYVDGRRRTYGVSDQLVPEYALRSRAPDSPAG